MQQNEEQDRTLGEDLKLSFDNLRVVIQDVLKRPRKRSRTNSSLEIVPKQDKGDTDGQQLVKGGTVPQEQVTQGKVSQKQVRGNNVTLQKVKITNPTLKKQRLASSKVSPKSNNNSTKNGAASNNTSQNAGQGNGALVGTTNKGEGNYKGDPPLTLEEHLKIRGIQIKKIEKSSSSLKLPRRSSRINNTLKIVPQQQITGDTVPQHQVRGGHVPQQQVTGSNVTEQEVKVSNVPQQQQEVRGGDVPQQQVTGSIVTQQEVKASNVPQQQQEVRGGRVPQQQVTGSIVTQQEVKVSNVPQQQQEVRGGRVPQQQVTGNNVTQQEVKTMNPTLKQGLAASNVSPQSNNKSTNNGAASNNTSQSTGQGNRAFGGPTKKGLDMLRGPDGMLPQRIRHLETHLLERIISEIMDQDLNVRWDDIAGLEHGKKCVNEMIVLPLLRPDIFKGCRCPGRGLLLFGPPGTGKTMMGKAIAGEVKATFFHISASSLGSKWIGEGEKLVRGLFGVAKCLQPAVIFVDEIDSILTKRSADEHECHRRLKTEFLIQMEGFDNGNDQILLIGATNRPQDLDEAARRRLTKRLYIPLPTSEGRAYIVRHLLEKDGLFNLSKEDIDVICNLTEGYSGSDTKNLVKNAAMGPLREAMNSGIDIATMKIENLRPVTLQDFKNSLQEIRPSISSSELSQYVEWNKQFGSMSF